MAEHTPGPWWIQEIQSASIITNGEILIAMTSEHFRYAEGEQEANANLIAAAPDMEKALEAVDNYTTRMLEMHPGAEVDESWWAVEKQIRAALAKAREG